jgi:alpha-L-fucosidase
MGSDQRNDGKNGVAKMRNFDYIKDFEKLGFGMFVHFGLYSVEGYGEWGYGINKPDNYYGLIERFNVKKDWAKELVATAKNAGCKYINITTRHHDGFSLYDTCGLSDFDVMHSATGRDLMKEFVGECNAQGLVPFFYHTCFDWHYQAGYMKKIGKIEIENQEEYETFFKESNYFDYWLKSIELLCTRYGKIGGFWFDGIWSCPNANWPLDELYAMIRKYQPEAMIINNTGLSELGKVGHYEIDSVTFERGKPCFVDNSDRPRAGEMCQTLNDHWGYAKEDINYKPVKELVENLIDCRKFGCNFLMNTGPMGDGSLQTMDKAIFENVGRWVKANKNFIYDIKPSNIKATNAEIVKGDGCYYALIKDVPMSADPNVQRLQETGHVRVKAKILSAEWLDNGEKIEVENDSFKVKPFKYSRSYSVRVAKLVIEE